MASVATAIAACAALVLGATGWSVARPIGDTAELARATGTTGPTARDGMDERFDALVRDAQLPFAGMLVFDGPLQVYERTTPGFDAATAIPIASASKWVAAALILTGVDRGELSLDDPVARFIPEATGTLRVATVRQLLSHSSGMQGRTLDTLGPVASLEESVLKLIAEPMAARPGARFAYGGVSMQVAGLILERAAKRPFATLFAERIAVPLGMKTAKFGSPRTWGTGEVPWVAGGMAMSLDDYRRFLAMMLAKGQAGSTRILSEASVAAIETDAVADIPIGFRPGSVPDGASYGLGVWCEAIDAGRRCTRVSSAGAFGAYPWLDRKAGRAGVFLTRSTLPRIRDRVYALREAASALPTGSRPSKTP